MRKGVLKSINIQGQVPAKKGMPLNILILSLYSCSWYSSLQTLISSGGPCWPYNASPPNSEIISGLLKLLSQTTLPGLSGHLVYQPIYLLAAITSSEAPNSSSIIILFPSYLK